MFHASDKLTQSYTHIYIHIVFKLDYSAHFFIILCNSNQLKLHYIYLFLVYCVGVYTCALVEARKEFGVSWISLSIMWFPVTKLRVLGLTERAFTN